LGAAGYADEALKVGFDPEAVFSLIVAEGKVEDAAQMLIDLHFNDFLEWFIGRRDEQSIEKVNAALWKHGRTLEANRVAQRCDTG
jgi:hypothetical protein